MRFLKFAVLAALLALPVSSANAGVLTSLISGANASPLQLNDDSRDFFVDLDQSGGVTSGDVLFGVVQIDSTTPPNISTNNQIVGVFSQTFDSITIDPTNGTASGTFTPTTAVGLTVSDLTGQAVDSDAFVAIFERAGGFSVDIDSFNIGDVTGVTDAFSLISSIAGEGVFDFSAGFRDGPGAAAGPLGGPDTGDFFGFETDLALATIDGALTAGPGALGNNIQLGTFGGGLSILDNNLGPGVLFFDDILAVSPFGNTFAELAIQGGTFSAVGPTLENDIFPIINNADFTFRAVVPEPGTVAIWSGLVAFCVSPRRRRRRS